MPSLTYCSLFSENNSNSDVSGGVKIIYHVDEEETPYLVKISKKPGEPGK